MSHYLCRCYTDPELQTELQTAFLLHICDEDADKP
jgi:hypothetical protein